MPDNASPKFMILWDRVMTEQFELLVSLAQQCEFGRSSLKGETPEHYVKSLYKASLSFLNAVDFQLLIKKEATGKYRRFWESVFPEAGDETLSNRFLDALAGLDVYNGRMPVDEYELEWRIKLRQQFLNALLSQIVGLETVMKMQRV